MDFYVMTLFPDMVIKALSESMTGRAMKRGLIYVRTFNIRDYTLEKHGKTDDYPFGGGPGMVMQVQPVYDCFRAVVEEDSRRRPMDAPARKPRVLLMSPSGRRFDQEFAGELAKEEAVVLICGHYEGIDERVSLLTGAEEVSLGDFVLTGGEYPAMAVIDAVSRLIPGVLGGQDSASEESFSDGLLEYPQYSRPEVFEGLAVPEVLLSGHHAHVKQWRRQKSLEKTLRRRPDLLSAARLSAEDREFLRNLRSEAENDPSWAEYRLTGAEYRPSGTENEPTGAENRPPEVQTGD